LKNAPQIYQRIIDNALWTMVRMISSKGVNCRVVGVTEEEVKTIVDDAAGGRVGSDMKLIEDVFHVGVAEEEDVRPVIGRRSYIDDVTFGARSWDELCMMLECLLDAFKYWGITISLPKSAFGKKVVEFLSHEVSREGLRAVPRNLEAILAMPFPMTVKGIQKFVGSLVYYHRFIDNFATYAAALYELTDVKLQDGSQLEHARKSFEALKNKLATAPILRHLDRHRKLVVILYTNRWAFGATVCQEHDGILHPVRFVSKVFKDAETRYTGAEQEVLALLKTLEAASNFLYGQQVTVHARHSTMKWLFTSKSLSGRAVQWAVMLSPWTLKIMRSDDDAIGLPALLAASITPRSELEAVLNEIAPMKTISDIPVIRPIPELRRDTHGFALTFDGAVRVKGDKIGTYGMILWALPDWTVVAAEYGVQPNLTVNDSEYHGLIGALQLAIKEGVTKVIVCGDSRIVIGQVNGDLRCNQASLQVWLNRVRNLLKAFEAVSFVHIARKYNQSADLLTRKAMSSRVGRRVETSIERGDLELLNTLPELLYRTSDPQDQKAAEPSEAKLSYHTKSQEPSVYLSSHTAAADASSPGMTGRDWWDSTEPEVMVHVATRQRRVDDQGMTTRQGRRRSKRTESTKKRDQASNRPDEASGPESRGEDALRVSDKTLSAAQDERFRRIAKAQLQDPWCEKVIAYLQGDDDMFPSSSALKVAKVADLYVLDAANVLYYCPSDKDQSEGRMRLVVSSILQEDILRAYHSELGGGAQGVGRVFARLRSLYYWRGMYANVEWFV
jgi:ribonuclease HI